MIPDFKKVIAFRQNQALNTVLQNDYLKAE